jgi:elongation factor P
MAWQQEWLVASTGVLYYTTVLENVLFRSQVAQEVRKQMPGTTSDIRNGLIIRYNGELYTIVEFHHVSPGNWRAFIRTKLKSLKTGRVQEVRLRSGEEIDIVRVEHRSCQYLYQDGQEYIFMHTETYDQFPLPIDLLGDGAQFLKEGMVVEALFDGDNVVGVELPTFINLEVTYTEQAVRGDTATNVLKAATVETGATVNVPLFVETGDVIKIDTRTGEYVERVKS